MVEYPQLKSESKKPNRSRQTVLLFYKELHMDRITNEYPAYKMVELIDRERPGLLEKLLKEALTEAEAVYSEQCSPGKEPIPIFKD